MNRIVIAIATLLLVSCAHHAGPRTEGQMSDYFHWLPAADAVGWVVFLPGSGGLRVLDDDRHYFNVAERLNQRGWSVLLVDYKPAYRASGAGKEGTPGEKIAWVTEEAVAWMRRSHPEISNLPGALVGWSLGAEGVLRIVNEGTRATTIGANAAALYYPSNKDDLQLMNHVPVLVLIGEADDVTRATDVQAMVRDRDSGAGPVELHLYPGAYHGFDVASLVKRRTVRLLPMIGPKATLQFDEASAADAEQRLLAFLANNALQPTR